MNRKHLTFAMCLICGIPEGKRAKLSTELAELDSSVYAELSQSEVEFYREVDFGHILIELVKMPHRLRDAQEVAGKLDNIAQQDTTDPKAKKEAPLGAQRAKAMTKASGNGRQANGQGQRVEKSGTKVKNMEESSK